MMEFNEELIAKYDKLIWKKARDFKNQSPELFGNIDLEDLHSEGLVTLAKCAEKYNPDNDKSAHFITYFYTALHNDLAFYFRNNSRSYRISADMNKDIIKATKLQNEGKTINQISVEMKIPEYEVVNLLNANLCSHSFDYTSNSAEDTNWLNYLPDDPENQDPYFKALQYLVLTFISSDEIKEKYKDAKYFTDNPKTKRKKGTIILRPADYKCGSDTLIENIFKELYCDRKGVLGRPKLTINEMGEKYNIDPYYLAPLLRTLTTEMEEYIYDCRDQVKELFHV